MEDIVRIKLGNRWRVSNELVQSVKDKNKFYLIFGDPKEWDWCRVLFKEGETDYNCKDFYAVDPSGGPFMAIGGKIRGYTIESISEELRDEEEIAFQGTPQEKAFTFHMKQKNEITDEKAKDKVIYEFDPDKRYMYEAYVEPEEYTMTCTLNGKSYKMD